MLPEEWAKISGDESFSPPSIAEEGFIHCSFRPQLDGVIERYYSDAVSLVILEIDPSKLSSELRIEPSTNDEDYPHIYGPLNLNAVIGVEDRQPASGSVRDNFKEVDSNLTPKKQQLLEQLDLALLPSHVAIIMDGNGRWAKKRGKQRIEGHREGAESVRSILDTFARLEIDAVTLYAFSTENWKRPEDEVRGLMEMLKYYIRTEIDEVHENRIRFRAIGDIAGLAEDVQKEIRDAEDKTAGNTGTQLNVALNYGGRAEIVEACRRAASEVTDPSEIDEDAIERNLYTYGLPEIDLMIRTSGEMRVSNFLLWQIAYSEIYVTETLFPDFRRAEIFRAFLEYQKRDRRFGGVKEAAAE